MQRKRSAYVGFSLMTLSAALIGCEQRQVQAPPAQGVERAQVFTSAEACEAQGTSAAECSAAQAAARVEHEQTAPQYASRADCEQQWSEGGGCEQRTHASGGSFFVPAMMGFFLGRAMSGGGGFGGASPVYGGRGGIFSGQTRLGDAQMRNGRFMAPSTVAFAGGAPSRAARGGFGRSSGYSGGGGRGG